MYVSAGFLTCQPESLRVINEILSPDFKAILSSIKALLDGGSFLCGACHMLVNYHLTFLVDSKPVLDH